MSRTVKSIYDFKPGQSVSFGLDTRLKYIVFYPDKGVYVDRDTSTFNNGWKVRKVTHHNGEWHLCLDCEEHPSANYFFMIPESELISKGIISPAPPFCVAGCDGVNLGYCETNERGCFEKRQPAVEEKLKSRTPEIEHVFPKISEFPPIRNGVEIMIESAPYPYAQAVCPPITLKPRRVLVSERIKEIVTAISQLDTMQEVIPQEWLEELVELNEWLKSKRK